MKPSCFNRLPFAGMWCATGHYRQDRNNPRRFRRVLRWVEHRMSDRCAAWDSGPSPIYESVPAREGWQCDGCRWLPAAAADFLHGGIDA